MQTHLGRLPCTRAQNAKYPPLLHTPMIVSKKAGLLSLLPDEILQMILEVLHREDCPMTPIMGVCKTLKILIINSPRLWRRILVSVDLMPPSLQTGSTMSCGGENLLRNCVERVRSAPIEATLVIGQITSDSPAASVRAERYKIVLQKSSQITFLCLIINPGTPISEVVESFQHIFTSGFEALESLMIASAVPLSGLIKAFSGLLDRINTTSTKLRSLYLENVSKEFVMEVRQREFWKALSRVTLKGEYQPLHAMVFDQCNKLDFLSFTGELHANREDAPFPVGATATQLQNNALSQPLHTMQDRPLTGDTSNEGRHDVQLPNLQWLRVGAITMHGLSQLVIPRVRFLVIQTALRDYVKDTPAPHSVIFPEVEVLHISSIHSHIACIVAPKLQTLCLQVQVLKKADANGILDRVFDGHPTMLTPKNLSLSSLAHDKYIISVLKKQSQLEIVTLIMQDLPKKALFEALKKPTVLPRLSSFTLELQSNADKGLEKRQRFITERMEEVKAAPARQRLNWLSTKWNGVDQIFVQCEVCGSVKP